MEFNNQIMLKEPNFNFESCPDCGNESLAVQSAIREDDWVEVQISSCRRCGYLSIENDSDCEYPIGKTGFAGWKNNILYF